MNADQLTDDELLTAFQRVPGLAAHIRAAVRLLIDHRRWPHRYDFRQAAVAVEVNGGLVYADVDWDGAVTLLRTAQGSTVDLAVLRLACTLAGRHPEHVGPEWTLQRILSDLEEDKNACALAITAFATATRSWAV